MIFKKLALRELTKEENDLVTTAATVRKNAYNIYSGFYVGAAVLTTDNKIYSGANMENASSGLSICAEPAAIQAANSAGDYDIKVIAIVGSRIDDKSGDIVTPCGRCRQIIYEASQVSGIDIYVILCNKDLSKILKTSISELLPMPFGPNDLGLSDKVKEFKNKK